MTGYRTAAATRPDVSTETGLGELPPNLRAIRQLANCTLTPVSDRTLTPVSGTDSTKIGVTLNPGGRSHDALRETYMLRRYSPPTSYSA